MTMVVAVDGGDPHARRAASTRLTLGVAAAALCAALSPAEAQSLSSGGVALVVGNERYEAIDNLANPATDARAMADMLREFGFRVYDGYDLDRQSFEELLRTALINADPDDEVLFFFAGHGIQIGQRNYLLPIDARFEDVYDLPKYSITLDRVIEALSARSSAHVAIIDACRENPFPDQMLATGLDASFYEARDGFQVMRTPLNSLVAFSASPGSLALDGEEGGHSPYTEALIGSVRDAPLENLPNVLLQVRERVYSATSGFQVPWESSTLVRPFILHRLLPDDGEPELVAETEPVPEPVEDPSRSESPASDPPALIAERDGPAPEETEAFADAPERKPEAEIAPLPDALTVTARFDRRVGLRAPLSEALGRPLDGATIVSTPTRGRIELAETAEVGAVTRGLVLVGLTNAVELRGNDITFRPALSEINTTSGDNFRVSDSFRMRLGPPEAPQTVTVNLELEIDACDLEAGDALDLQGVGYYRWPNEIEPAAALAACAAAVDATPGTPRFLYQYGRAQLASRDFEGAYRSFRTAAEAGHIRAFNALATLLSGPQIDRDVIDVPLDLEEARELRERGIAQGDPFAMHSLGLRLLRDGTTAAERERGFELLDRAAEMGHTFSMNELGYQFLNPDSDRYQPGRGMAYLTVSSERDDIYGHHNLGLVALRGLDGSEPDFERARDYLLRAAEGGHPRAPGDLGRMYGRGQLGQQNLAQALHWFDIGLARGDGASGANSVEIILSGQSRERSPADAAVRAAKVIEMPNSNAAERAREQLERIEARAQDRATQMLLVELGEGLTVDGIFGPASRAALARQSAAYEINLAADTSTERLLLAARAWWAANPLRLDLF